MSRIQTTIRALVVTSIGVFLSGCIEAGLARGAAQQHSLGQKYSPDTTVPPNRAAVYVYRPEFVGFAVSPNVSANGVPLADVPVYSYFVYHAAPGALELSSRKESVTLDVKAGETYYVKGEPGSSFLPALHLVLMPKDVGEREIKECCKLVSGTIPTAETVAAGPQPAVPKK